MKVQRLSVLLVFAAAAARALGQGTVIYDQQSAAEGAPGEGGGGISGSEPFGQSFTPALNSVRFIRLWLSGGAPGNGIGSTVFVNLRSDSITGPILSTTDPVFLSDGFGYDVNGYPDFVFSTPVPVTPGMTYYFEPILQSGDYMRVFGDAGYGYAGGSMFFQGTPRVQDLWFREGIIVPEPSTGWLALVGAGLLAWFQRHKRRRNHSLA